jgi:hypothetical protein
MLQISLKLILSRFFFLVLILAGCKSQPKTTQTIVINGGKFIEISSDNILANIALTPLETSPECMIGEQFRVLESERDFYILDDVSKLTTRFGADGQFLNIIGKKGKGPGEYVEMFDAIVSGNAVELLTGFPSTEVTYYTAEGFFIERKKWLELASLSLITQPKSNDYLFYGTSWGRKIQRIDKNSGKIADSMLVNTEGAKVFRVHPFSKTSYGTILFCELFINKIYEINSEGIQEKYRLDLGKYTIEQDMPTRDFMKRASETGVWAIDRALESDDYLYISISRYMQDGNSSRSHFIFRKSDQVIFTLSEKDSFSSAFGPAYHLDQNGDLFLSVRPLEAINCKAWTHYFETNRMNIAEDQNPVLVKFNIRSIIKNTEK